MHVHIIYTRTTQSKWSISSQVSTSCTGHFTPHPPAPHPMPHPPHVTQCHTHQHLTQCHTHQHLTQCHTHHTSPNATPTTRHPMPHPPHVTQCHTHQHLPLTDTIPVADMSLNLATTSPFSQSTTSTDRSFTTSSSPPWYRPITTKLG